MSRLSGGEGFQVNHPVQDREIFFKFSHFASLYFLYIDISVFKEFL